jgi:transcriptional regulator with XRE-family HTH domain
MPDKEFLKIVGALIAKARINKGLVQEQVASMVGLSRPQVCNIEKGIGGTTSETMFKLSIIFDCPIGDLFPSSDRYKPKLKIPPPRNTRPGRKERGPNTSKLAYQVMKENEELKKQLEQYKQKEVNNETT